MEASLAIREKLKFENPLPYTKDWTTKEDFLELLINVCTEKKPKTILTCSSGLSTIVLARCCQLNDRGHVFSLENGAEYAKVTQKQLKQLNIEESASVLYAPLEPIQVNGKEYLWYQTKQIPHDTIDLLVIDGPASYIQKNVRYPTLPLLYKQLSESCEIFFHDTLGQDQQEIINLWVEQYPNYSQAFKSTDGQCSILKPT